MQNSNGWVRKRSNPGSRSARLQGSVSSRLFFVLPQNFVGHVFDAGKNGVTSALSASLFGKRSRCTLGSVFHQIILGIGHDFLDD